MNFLRSETAETTHLNLDGPAFHRTRPLAAHIHRRRCRLKTRQRDSGAADHESRDNNHHNALDQALTRDFFSARDIHCHVVVPILLMHFSGQHRMSH